MINGLLVDEYFDLDALAEVNKDFWTTNLLNFRGPSDIQRHYAEDNYRTYLVFKQDDNKPYLAKTYIFEGYSNWIHIKLPNNKFMRRKAKSMTNHHMLPKYLHHFAPIYLMFQDYTQMTFYNESRIYIKFYPLDLSKKNIMLSFVFGFPDYDLE